MTRRVRAVAQKPCPSGGGGSGCALVSDTLRLGEAVATLMRDGKEGARAMAVCKMVSGR